MRDVFHEHAIPLLCGNAVGWPFEPSEIVYLGAGVFWLVLGAGASFRGLIYQAWTDA